MNSDVECDMKIFKVGDYVRVTPTNNSYFAGMEAGNYFTIQHIDLEGDVWLAENICVSPCNLTKIISSEEAINKIQVSLPAQPVNSQIYKFSFQLSAMSMSHNIGETASKCLGLQVDAQYATRYDVLKAINSLFDVAEGK